MDCSANICEPAKQYQTSFSRVLWSWHRNTCTCCSSAWLKLRQDCGKMKASPSAPLIRRSFCHVLGFIYCARNFRPAGARPSTVKPNPCPAWSEHFARKNVEALGSPVVMLEGSPGRSTGMCSDWTQRAPKATSVKCDQMWFLEPSVCSQSTWWFRSLVLNWAVLADRLLTLHGCFFLLSAVPSLGDKPGANCFNELAMSNLSCSWPQRSMASDLEGFRERTTKYTPA